MSEVGEKVLKCIGMVDSDLLSGQDITLYYGIDITGREMKLFLLPVDTSKYSGAARFDVCCQLGTAFI